MTQVNVRCINGGNPFTVGAEDITIGALKGFIRSEATAKKAWENIDDSGLASIMDALMPLMLKIAGRKDAAWKGRSIEDFEDELTLPEIKSFMAAVAEAMPKAVASAEQTIPLA